MPPLGSRVFDPSARPLVRRAARRLRCPRRLRGPGCLRRPRCLRGAWGLRRARRCRPARTSARIRRDRGQVRPAPRAGLGEGHPRDDGDDLPASRAFRRPRYISWSEAHDRFLSVQRPSITPGSIGAARVPAYGKTSKKRASPLEPCSRVPARARLRRARTVLTNLAQRPVLLGNILRKPRRNLPGFLRFCRKIQFMHDFNASRKNATWAFSRSTQISRRNTSKKSCINVEKRQKQLESAI